MKQFSLKNQALHLKVLKWISFLKQRISCLNFQLVVEIFKKDINWACGFVVSSLKYTESIFSTIFILLWRKYAKIKKQVWEKVDLHCVSGKRIHPLERWLTEWNLIGKFLICKIKLRNDPRGHSESKDKND